MGSLQAGPGDTWTLHLRVQRLEAGPGAVERLGELIEDRGARRVLLVSDEGIASAGHVDRVRGLLERSADRVEVFAEVGENPTEAEVERGAEVARSFEPQLIVALGGGSPMDCAKGINFISTNGGRMEDYWGFAKAEQPMLPSIGIPCTTGTGSEAQSFALISRDRDHVKMACGDEKARFGAVILDPDFAVTQPADVLALTALDAVSHAIEASVTRTRNPLSRLYARGAWELLAVRLEEVTGAEGRQAPAGAWLDMLVGSHLAGLAIETSMLGAAHALANPLTARTGLAHGAAVAMVLPTVIRWNSESDEEFYRDLARAVRVSAGDVRPAGEVLASWVEDACDRLGLPAIWDRIALPWAEVGDLAAEAAAQWTATHNPRPVQAVDAETLYRRAWTRVSPEVAAAGA